MGRNGSGKSTILRTIAEKLIPAFPLSVRVAILQQTSDVEDGAAPSGDGNKNVMEQVVGGDPYRNSVIEELDILSKALESSNNPLAPVRALRQVKHGRLEFEFFQVQKQASLRSGARGYDARKVLIAFEKKVEGSKALLNQDDAEMDEETIAKETQEAVSLQSELLATLETMQQSELEARAKHILSGLGFKEAQLRTPFNQLSGGWKMRCQLAAALAQAADILVLDEPTNFLDLFGILWLQRHLATLSETQPRTTVLLVSHDRDFVNATCEDIIIVRNRGLHYFNGNLAAWQKSVRHETLRLARMKEAQDKQVAHMEKTIAQNMRQAKKTGDENRVRQAKSRQKKLDERTGVNVSASGHRFKLNRDRAGYFAPGEGRAAVEVPEAEREVHMWFPDPPELRFPGALIAVESASFRYPKAPAPVLQGVSLVVHPGDRLGLMGLNGAGKSTLIQLLVGGLRPGTGTITRHPRLRVGYYAQHAVDELRDQGQREPQLTALALILRDDGDETGGREAVPADEKSEKLLEQEARALLSGLGLGSQAAAHTPVRGLSGGQLARLAMARVLRTLPQLLILDEPSTHLDLPSVTGLARGLKAFGGAVILVTHDRFLVRCVVEGESVDEEGSDDEDEGGEESESEVERRRLVYEVKAGKVVEKAKGVMGWENGLVGRLKKLGL